MATREELYQKRGILFDEAVILVIRDEINILRAKHALAPRTNQQIIDAIDTKLATLTKHSWQNTVEG